MPPAPKLPPPPPPPSQTPSMQATREESEAKMRERLIERAKRLRKAVNDGRSVPGLPDEERTVQVIVEYRTLYMYMYMYIHVRWTE